MISNENEQITQFGIYEMLWVIFGGILGVVFSMLVVTEQAQNLFPQLGNFGKLINVVAVGFLGMEITKRCQPTRRALIGGVVFPLLLFAELFFTTTPNPISLAVIIGRVSAGVLSGILVGTAWQGALIGMIAMAVIVIPLGSIIHETIGWGWVFIPMGAIAGAGIQIAILEIMEKRSPRGGDETIE